MNGYEGQHIVKRSKMDGNQETVVFEEIETSDSSDDEPFLLKKMPLHQQLGNKLNNTQLEDKNNNAKK